MPPLSKVFVDFSKSDLLFLSIFLLRTSNTSAQKLIVPCVHNASPREGDIRARSSVFT